MHLLSKRLFSLTLFVILAAAGQDALAKGELNIRHTVSLPDVSAQRFHITTEIGNIDQAQLSLSLPTWTPGWYTVENYFKNVARFRVTDSSGRTLPMRMSRKQTWNVDTRGLKQIRVDYEYEATVLGLNQAKIASDMAFFTGIQLFLEPGGHRDDPATVKFNIPAGWKLHTALADTPDPTTFRAANYDVLVDAPVLMGNFEITRFEVEGKPHYFAAYPAGAFNAEKTKRFTEMLSASIKAQSGIFGGLPYQKYTAFYFFMPAESNASGALEHINSYVAFAPAGANSTPEGIIGTASHEFFHLWNVKRIRPAEMWPYDYSRENETPLLWVSEGFTNYYGALSNYRGGNITREQFLNSVAGAAEGVENNEARKFISPANASVSTWVGYDTPTAFAISYYGQGQNLAALLDLSIRNDTNAASGLDDVMRTLHREHYERGRGFTSGDLIAIINRLTKRDYNEFFDRYVFGTDVPDYNRIFGYAGYRFEQVAGTTPFYGMSNRPKNGGFTLTALVPNGPAEAAGLKVGDTIIKVDGTPTFQANWGSFGGRTVKLTIVRDGEEREIPLKVGSRETMSYKLVDVSSLSASQTKVRDAWLRR